MTKNDGLAGAHGANYNNLAAVLTHKGWPTPIKQDAGGSRRLGYGGGGGQ